MSADHPTDTARTVCFAVRRAAVVELPNIITATFVPPVTVLIKQHGKSSLQPEHTTRDDFKLAGIHRAYWLSLIVGIACIVFQVTGLVEPLRFSRPQINDGQWWRLLTGNLVHLGYPHLLLNLAGLAVISLLLAPAMKAWQWALTGLASMAGVGTGLLLLDPQLNWYVGLSGVLYGLLLGGAIAEFRHQKVLATILIIYTVGKIIWEQIYGAVESSEKITGGNVIVNAHLYGTVCGGLAALLLVTICRRQKHD
jgi:rhomboid family GlyGly-CTERM serine protease